MSQEQERRGLDIKMDEKSMYLEEIFTDRRIGTIRRLTPVKSDGKPDDSRPVIWTGETQVMTPMGALPIGFEIPAKTLDEAASKFGPLAKAAIERAVKELQEMRREAASSIVIPQGGLPPGGLGGGGMGGLGGGGMGGGGKIQMP